MNLKVLTLNAHGIRDGGTEERIGRICDLLEKELPDVVALQEADQTEKCDYADTDHTEGYYRAATCVHPVPLKRDNFAMELVWQMGQRGIAYHFTYLPVKRGYGKYDEGLAFLCRSPIRTACGFYISKSESYEDWNTRMALLCEVKESGLLLCNVHTSRYDSEREPFYEQWKRLTKRLPENRRILLMGDFNCPDSVRGEGYDRVCESGYFDMYRLADERIGERATVDGEIDGWRDGAESGRIDYIFSNFYPKVERITYSRVFDGDRGERVSDHFGVMVNFEGLESEL